jgi:hypothetical protein
MRNILGISAVAISVAMLAVAPASALSVSLGGNGGGGLLNLGSGGNAATVDTGNLLNTDANGGVLGTSLLGGSGNTDATATVDLGGTGNGQLLDLFGDGNTSPTTASVNLGGGGGTRGDVLLDLFGNGSGNDANVTLGSGRNAGVATPQSAAVLDLFGPGSGGDGSNGATPGSANRDFGGSAGGPAIIAPVQIASIDAAGANCFTPNSTQAAKLASRHAYDDATFSGWRQASSIKIVDVGLCDGAGAGIASDNNVARLQAFVAAQPTLRNSLGKLGHAPGDVIGVDRTGQTLVVYVM